MVKPATTSMSVNLIIMKQNQDITVTVRLTVQILLAVLCVNVGKATVEMESFVEVSTCDNQLNVNVLYSIKQFI